MECMRRGSLEFGAENLMGSAASLCKVFDGKYLFILLWQESSEKVEEVEGWAALNATVSMLFWKEKASGGY